MIRRFFRWALLFRAVRMPFTKWQMWLEPTRGGSHPGGFFIDVDDREGLIQLGKHWQVWMQNYGPSWAERYEAWNAQQDVAASSPEVR
ncbi:MAG: hypothetical protein ACN6RK_10185 [Stenotrophomonas sp.]